MCTEVGHVALHVSLLSVLHELHARRVHLKSAPGAAGAFFTGNTDIVNAIHRLIWGVRGVRRLIASTARCSALLAALPFRQTQLHEVRQRT